MSQITVRIVKSDPGTWSETWIGKEFEIDPDAARHTNSMWAVMKAPQGDNHDSGLGYMYVPKEWCEIVK